MYKISTYRRQMYGIIPTLHEKKIDKFEDTKSRLHRKKYKQCKRERIKREKKNYKSPEIKGRFSL